MYSRTLIGRQDWLKAAKNEDNWCAWFLILLKFELILVLFCWWALVLIVGATWGVVRQNIGLFMTGNVSFSTSTCLDGMLNGCSMCLRVFPGS